MDKKIVNVFGAGRMGRVAGWALDKLGYAVRFADNNADSLKQTKELVHNSEIISSAGGQGEAIACVSCLPYMYNFELAKECIDHGVPYFDLGGHVDTDEKINAYAKEKGGTVFTSNGLAPGLVNIMVEANINKVPNPANVLMICGGLPSGDVECGPLQYVSTWSSEGLLNEYFDDCKILKGGRIETVPGMSGLEDKPGGLEIFRTSGGASHTLQSMQELGVKNCEYKTMRYVNHCKDIQYLREICHLTDAELVKILSPKNIQIKDTVYASVDIDDGRGNFCHKAFSTECNDMFSAMQQATAFPLAAAVDTVLTEMDYCGGGALTYSIFRVKENMDAFTKSHDFLRDTMERLL